MQSFGSLGEAREARYFNVSVPASAASQPNALDSPGLANLISLDWVGENLIEEIGWQVFTL